MPATPDASPADSAYRLAPAIAARLIGGLLLLAAVLVAVTTLVVAVLGLPAGVLAVVVLLGLAGVLVVGYRLTRGWVVRFGSTGYRIRLVRGAGVAAASWREVEEAVTTTRDGAPVVVLKLTGERATTLPVPVLNVDREEFVRDLQRHLQHGQGLRPLG